MIDGDGRHLRDHFDGCNLTSPDVCERVKRYFLEASPSCFPMFGVIRRQILAETSLILPLVSSDKILLLQLALKGKFHEVPERLFYCREHPDRGSRQFRTFHGVATWYDPRNRGKCSFPRWRLAWEYLKAIGCAGLGVRASHECVIAVLKWCRWNYRTFIRDLVLGVQYLGARIVYSAEDLEKHDVGPGNPWSTWRL